MLVLGSAIPAWLGGEVNGYLGSGFSLLVGSTFFVPLAVKVLRLVLLALLEHWFGVPARLALDNVERSLTRSAITVVALMSAVSMSMSVGGYVQSFERSLVQWADDAFPSDAVVTAGSPLMDRHHIAFAESELDKLSNIPGLRRATPTSTFTIDLGDSRFPVHALDTRTLFAEAVRKGRMRHVIAGPSTFAGGALYDTPRVLVSETTAQQHGLSPGSQVRLQTPQGEKTFEVYAVVVDYASTSGWMMMDRRWFKTYWDEQLVDAIDLYFTDGADGEQVAATVRERLGAYGLVRHPARGAARGDSKGRARHVRVRQGTRVDHADRRDDGRDGHHAGRRDRPHPRGRHSALDRRDAAEVAASLVAEATFLGLAAALCGVIVGVPLGFVLVKVVGLAASGWSLPYAFPTATALRMSLLVVAAAACSGLLPGRAPPDSTRKKRSATSDCAARACGPRG